MTFRCLRYFYRSLVALFFILVSSTSFAASFQLLEQSGTTTGDFHAAGAADISNVSTEFYNPAILAAIHHQQVSFGTTAFLAESDFNGTIQNVFIGLPPTPTPVGGLVSESANLVPNFHYVLPFQNNHLAFGVGIDSAYGLETNYGPFPQSLAALGQAATYSMLQTVNFNPSLAWAITRHILIGAGFDLVYGDAGYNNNILLGPPGFAPALSFQNTFDGYGHGYNVGILFLLSSKTRVGASYRSEVDLDLSGKSSLTGFPSTNGFAKFPLPPLSIFSIYQQFTQRLAFMFSAFYTEWDVFKTLSISHSALTNLLGPDFILTVPQNYKNSWTYSLGMHYVINPRVLFKMGLGYDDTPTQDGFRDIRLPDSNRVYLAGGLHFTPTKKFAVDLGYIHVFFVKANVDNSKSSAGSGGIIPIVLGTSHSTANVVAFQLTYNIS